MKLLAIDQVSVSAVKPDSLRPGEEFTVSDAHGEELLGRHPDKFRTVGDNQLAEASNTPPFGKSNPAPLNKAEPAPKNKSDSGPEKHKGEAPDYQEMTVAKLKEIAIERCIDLGDATRKDDIIAAIELSDEQGDDKTAA